MSIKRPSETIGMKLAGAMLAVSMTAAFAGVAAAENAEAPSAKTKPTPVTSTTAAVSPQTLAKSAMNDLFKLNRHQLKIAQQQMMASQQNPRAANTYDYEKDKSDVKAMDSILVKLQNGADPNYIDPNTGASLGMWGLWYAYETDRLDVAQTFIDKGLDIKKEMFVGTPLPMAMKNALLSFYGPVGVVPPVSKDTGILVPEGDDLETHPSQKRPQMEPPKNPMQMEPALPLHTTKISYMDLAVWTLAESQTLYRSHVDTAIGMVKLMEKGGLTYKDAKIALTPEAKGYANVARNLMGTIAIKDAGLGGGEKFDEVTKPKAEILSEIKNVKVMTPELMRKFGAKLINFPDAVPGGPEPYKIVKGDTLATLAKRFVNAMGAENEEEAARKIAEKNSLKFESNEDLETPLEAGKEILLPVPPEHQIGLSQIAAGPQTLQGAAYRLKDAMGAGNENEAFTMLMQANGLEPSLQGYQDAPAQLDYALLPGKVLSYPVKGKKELAKTTIIPSDLVYGVALNNMRVMDAHPEKVHEHAQGASIEATANELARLNGYDLGALKSGAQRFEGKFLVVNFHNDGFNHMKALTPPDTLDPERKVTLIASEDKSYHGKQTYRTTANTAFALNPQTDMSLFVRLGEFVGNYPNQELSDALKLLMNLDGSPLQDRVVITTSEGLPVPAGFLLDMERMSHHGDSSSFESYRLMIEAMEKNKPISFSAAGNMRMDQSGYAPPQMDGPEGEYRQMTPISLSPRQYNVGAAGKLAGGKKSENSSTTPDKYTIAPYSSIGAIVCSVLPNEIGSQLEGTSFSGPSFASIYRQMLEWYGNILSPEEIMATGLMVADRDILDFDIIDKIAARDPKGGFSPAPAVFATNGGGLPYHPRCGAGNIDAEKTSLWNEKLKEMVALKKGMKNPGQTQTHGIEFGKPEIQKNSSGKEEYVYRAAIPEDLTIDRLLFLVPQDRSKHSDVFVKMPSGFESKLLKSPVDITQADEFRYEDVRVGDIIEVRTAQPFSPHAGIRLRGTQTFGKADGNVIQIMRDKLRSEGIMFSPLKALVGGKEVTLEEAHKTLDEYHIVAEEAIKQREEKMKELQQQREGAAGAPGAIAPSEGTAGTPGKDAEKGVKKEGDYPDFGYKPAKSSVPYFLPEGPG